MKQLLKELHPHLCQNGVAGFINYFELPNHRFLTRVLLAIDRRFVGVLQFARDWVHFESQIEYRSVPEVAKAIYDYLALDVIINDIPTEFSRPGQPVILLGLNHEAVVEPIVLISLLNRNDVKYPGMKVFQYLGSNIAPNILPLLPTKVATDYCGSTKPSFSNRLDPIYQLYCLENKSTEDIRWQNQSSIQQASEHISKGGALVIFPTGGQNIDSSWYQGIGQIISGLPPEIIASTPIFPISISGLTRNMIYWKIHQAAFNRQEASSVTVNVYEPIYMPLWAGSAKPARILEYLRQETDTRLDASSLPHQLSERARIHSDVEWARITEKSIN